MKIYVVGAGAIGSFLAYQFLKSGLDVTLVSKSAEASKITLELKDSDKTFDCNIIHPDKLSFDSDNCIVFFTLKFYELPDSLKKIKNMNLHYVFCQNGLDIIEEAKKYLDFNQWTRMLCWFGVQIKRLPPTHWIIQLNGLRGVEFTSASQKCCNEIVKIMEKTTLPFSEIKSIKTLEWKKVFVNLVTNSICTVLRTENFQAVTHPDLRLLATDLLKEAYPIAKAHGLEFDESIIDQTLEKISATRKNRNSTLQDFERGAKLELDLIWGSVLRLASKYTIDAPVITTLYRCLKFMDQP